MSGELMGKLLCRKDYLPFEVQRPLCLSAPKVRRPLGLKRTGGAGGRFFETRVVCLS